jgi:ligand-binding sensor domain-containing protein/anti-sigma regulatory factor (Ser/Thr protein kinase)
MHLKIQKYRLFWLIFLSGLILNSSGQDVFFTKYTTNEGLVNNVVKKIFQDSKGFLWICTWEGLSKYDGNRFTNFTESNGLSHNLVNDLVETKEGNLYVAMNNGSVDVIKNDIVAKKELFKNVIINNFIRTANRSLLALTDNDGIVEIHPNGIKQISNPKGISFFNMVPLNDSLVVVSGNPSPVFIYDHQFHIKTFEKNQVNNPIIYKDQQNRVWLATNNGLKLISMDQHSGKLIFKDPPPPFNVPLLNQVNVTAILQQQNGSFWIGTDKGLINILPNNQTVLFTEKDGLPSRNISYIFNDRENNLWIGTSLGLAKKMLTSPVQVFDPSVGEPAVASLAKKINDEELLISSKEFFYRYNFKTGEIQNILKRKKNEDLVYITNSSPLLFIYKNRIVGYDIASNKIETVTTVPPTEYFFSATICTDKTIFIGTFDGLMIHYNKRTINDTTFKNRIHCILADRNGFVWIGTWENGLYRGKFDVVSGKWQEIIHFKLPDGHIRSLFEDSKGDMWIGTRYSGVLKIKKNQVNDPNPMHLHQQNGLSSNWIGNISEDENGNIWLAGISGLDKVIRKSNDFEIFNFSRVMRFISNANLAVPVGNSKLFCSTINGMFLITDNKLEQLPPQNVYLTRINLGDTDYHSEILSSKKVLPYIQNHTSFEFTTPIYQNEKAILYSYRLIGAADTTWSHLSNLHSVQYASLEPGDYKFEVRMLGWNGTYGPVTTLGFRIRPPYWKTWWFYSLIIAGTLLLLYSFYGYRINQLVRLQKVRNTIATDLHDDIGSTLTNISILSELSKKNLGVPHTAEKYLQRITEESVASQQALDDIIWSVNTRYDTMNELQARMRRYAAELFENNDICCQFSLDANQDSKLDMQQRRDVYLVFRECLNNIYKHADAKNVYIEIVVRNNVLKMNIEDDGKGFDPSVSTHRNGLKNLETRIERWNGTLNIESEIGNGTRIEVTMPVKTSLLK